MNYATLLFALTTGALIALQFGVNASLRKFLGANTPLFATAISYAVGALVSLICLLLVRPAMPTWNRVIGVPWWAWIGGAVGVGYVSGTVLLAPKLGATKLIVLIVAGQLIASIVFDQYGLIGYERHPMNGMRALGCVFLVAAVVLLRTN